MKRCLAILLLLSCSLGCATYLERGEQLYRDGDRLAALDTWRKIPESSANHDAAQARVAAVEREFAQLVRRYEKQAHYFEQKGRLGESLLSFRLALKLTPDNRDLLAHAQKLSRTLAANKHKLHTEWDQAFRERDLSQARKHLADLRWLDPFDPAIELAQSKLYSALSKSIDHNMKLGRRGFSSGQYSNAKTAFKAVLELDPENESAKGYLSYIATIRSAEQGSGRRPASFQPPEIEATDREIRAEGFYQNALAAMRAGDPFQAIDYDLRALRADPNHSQAREHLEQVRAQNRGQVEDLIESGRVAFQQEDLQTALDHWRNVLLVDPNNARIQEFVARAERMLNNLGQLRAEPEIDVSAPKRPTRR